MLGLVYYILQNLSYLEGNITVRIAQVYCENATNLITEVYNSMHLCRITVCSFIASDRSTKYFVQCWFLHLQIQPTYLVLREVTFTFRHATLNFCYENWGILLLSLACIGELEPPCLVTSSREIETQFWVWNAQVCFK